MRDAGHSRSPDGYGRRGGTAGTGLLLSLFAVVLSAGCRGREAAPADGPRGSGVPAAEAPAGPPSVLLISIDTTRADRLGCYGRNPSPTPTIDRWAAEGVVFQHAVTPVPITLPSHATLLTGRLPYHHGVRDNGIYRVPADVPTLAETLSKAGYQTAGVVGSAVLDRQFGLARGFGIWDDGTNTGGGLAIAERRAAAVTDAALAAAGGLKAPFFLFVHYFDPHAPYAPPAPFDARYPSEPYVGEIAYVDQEIGRLRRGLEEKGLLRGAVVVVDSDHGESLGEHGEETHGVFLYESTVHVPLVVSAPGRWPAGRRVRGLVSLADVAPTLAALAGATGLEDADGRDLAPALSRDPGERWLPLESEFGANSYGWAPLAGLTDGTLKWVEAPRPELYDLTADPHEEKNLAGARPEDLRRLEKRWRDTVRDDRRSFPTAAASDREEAERLEKLAALGYVAGSAAPRTSDPSSLPDPKDAISSLGRINEARALIERRQLFEAQRVLAEALRQSPRNVSGLVLLGASRILAGQLAAAIRPLERAAELSPANADVQQNLGLARAGTGDARGAEAAFRRALVLAPRSHDAAVNLVDLLVNTGRPDQAWDVLRRARANGLGGPALDYLEGKLQAARGDREAARRLLEQALAGGLPPTAVEEAHAILRQLFPSSPSP